MAVSRFTAAKPADRSTAAIGPNAVAGSASSRAVRPAKFTSPAKASVILPAARTAPPCLPASPAWPGAARLVVAARGDGGAAVQADPASTASTPDTTATTRRITTSPAYGCPRGRRPPAPPPPGSHDRACAARLPSSRSATPHRLDGRPQVASTDGVTLSDRQAYGERPPSKLSFPAGMLKIESSCDGTRLVGLGRSPGRHSGPWNRCCGE